MLWRDKKEKKHGGAKFSHFSSQSSQTFYQDLILSHSGGTSGGWVYSILQAKERLMRLKQRSEQIGENTVSVVLGGHKPSLPNKQTASKLSSRSQITCFSHRRVDFNRTLPPWFNILSLLFLPSLLLFPPLPSPFLHPISNLSTHFS